MLRQIFHFNRAEGSKTGVQCCFRKFYTYYFQSFDQFAAEVHTGRRCGNGTFILGIYRLVALFIFFFRLAFNVFRQRGFTQNVQNVAKFLFSTVKKEAYGTAAGSCVVNNFSYQLVVVTEVQLVAHAYFTCRVYNYIPKVIRLIQFAQQKYFYLGTGLFFPAIKAGREYLGVVHYHHILVMEIAKHVFEYFMFYLASIAMNYHEAAFFTFFCGVLRDEI